MMQRFLVLPDVHAPWHNVKIYRALMRLVVDLRGKIDGIVISGDFVDCYTLGRYNVGSLAKLTGLTLSEEYASAAGLLDDLHKALGPGAKKLLLEYLYGNHEDRHTRHLADGDNAKVGSALASPAEGLRLRERGWNVRDDWEQDYVLLGKHLEVSHGKHCTINPCRTFIDRMSRLSSFHGAGMFGHTHRWSTLVQGKQGAFNIGFLGDKQSKGFSYVGRAREEWVNGFAEVAIDDDGDYWATPIQCWKDSFVRNGKRY